MKDRDAHDDEACGADQEASFLPIRATNLGTTGTATKVDSDVASTIQIR